MKIIAVVSQKGGVGKTTIATSIAVEAFGKGKNPSILDLDSQSSVAFWANVREVTWPSVKNTEPCGLKSSLEVVRQAGCQLAIIDSPPFAKDLAFEAARYADLILVPVKPAVFDLASIARTLDLTAKFDKRAIVILSICPFQGPEIADTEATIKKMGAMVCPVRIHNRIAYSRSQQKGLTVQEFEPNGKAAGEVKRLYEFVKKECGL